MVYSIRQKMKNRILVIFVAMSLCLVACTDADNEKAEPNIIYVLADDMGYGDVSRLNSEGKIKTPT